jgi:Secretion system C-terminal sorting domain/Right handed beta helix region
MTNSKLCNQAKTQKFRHAYFYSFLKFCLIFFAFLTLQKPIYGQDSYCSDCIFIQAQTNMNQAVEDAIIEARYKQLNTIQLCAGTFVFTETLSIPQDIILRGMGSNATQLVFNLASGQADCISVNSYANKSVSTDFMGLQSDKIDYYSNLKVRSVQGFNIGDRIFIDDKRSENGQNIQIGQFRQILSIDEENQLLLIDNPLDFMFFSRKTGELDFTEKGLQVHKVFSGGGGIQNLKISRVSPKGTQAANVRVSPLTQNVTIQGVESVKCTGAHINIEQSLNTHVKDCYAHDAYDWGGNKQAYGVVCELAAANCLIENNAFEVLRHAMVVQYGANNNLFRNNIARNSRWNQIYTFIKSGDIQIHGNLAYNNTFENNFVDKIWMDQSGDHLKNGPNNKVIQNPSVLSGFASVRNSCEDTSIIFSTEKIWNTDCEEIISIVRTNKTPSKAAKIRLERDGIVTLPSKNNAQCALGFQKEVDEESAKKILECSPSPTSGILNITFQLSQMGDVELNLVTISGKVVQNLYHNRFSEQGSYTESLNLAHITKGFYFVVLKQNNRHLNTQKIIIN